MSDLEKLKKHLGRPIPISITNPDGVTDVFYFKPLNVEQQAILMELSNQIQSRGKKIVEIEEKGKKVKKEIPIVNKEDMKEMFGLIKDVVKDSIKDIDEETLNDFCNTNFEQLSDALFKLMPENQNKDIDLIKKRQEVVTDVKNTGNKE